MALAPFLSQTWPSKWSLSFCTYFLLIFIASVSLFYTLEVLNKYLFLKVCIFLRQNGIIRWNHWGNSKSGWVLPTHASVLGFRQSGCSYLSHILLTAHPSCSPHPTHCEAGFLLLLTRTYFFQSRTNKTVVF